MGVADSWAETQLVLGPWCWLQSLAAVSSKQFILLVSLFFFPNVSRVQSCVKWKKTHPRNRLVWASKGQRRPECLSPLCFSERLWTSVFPEHWRKLGLKNAQITTYVRHCRRGWCPLVSSALTLCLLLNTCAMQAYWIDIYWPLFLLRYRYTHAHAHTHENSAHCWIIHFPHLKYFSQQTLRIINRSYLVSLREDKELKVSEVWRKKN